MAKRPNQTDATLRNVRAAKTRINGVAKRLVKLHAQHDDLILTLEARVDSMARELSRLRRVVERRGGGAKPITGHP